MRIYKKSPYEQLEFSEMPKYVKVPPPTWETAMSIYVEVLKNPTASEKGKQIAAEDLMNLARTVDRCDLIEREAA